jgi:cell division protein FtsB
MPSARPATAAPRRARDARTAARPRRVAQRGPKGRVRWDRVGRVGLLVVLAVVAGLYVQQGLAYLSTHAQAEQQLAIVHRLTHENAVLEQQQRSLNDPATIQRDARALGMVRTGERPYVITGLPNR